MFDPDAICPHSGTLNDSHMEESHLYEYPGVAFGNRVALLNYKLQTLSSVLLFCSNGRATSCCYEIQHPRICRAIFEKWVVPPLLIHFVGTRAASWFALQTLHKRFVTGKIAV